MKNTTKIGNKAEEAVVDFLNKNGHDIITRNERSRYYELDIISSCGEYIVVTEVKYRRSGDFGGGLGAVNADKIRRLKNGFEMRLAENCRYASLQPRIDVAAAYEDGTIEIIENAVN